MMSIARAAPERSMTADMAIAGKDWNGLITPPRCATLPNLHCHGAREHPPAPGLTPVGPLFWISDIRLFAWPYRRNRDRKFRRIALDQLDEASICVDERNGGETFHAEDAERGPGRVKRQGEARLHLGLVFGQVFGCRPHLAHHAKPRYAWV